MGHPFNILMNGTESKENYSHILKYTGVFGSVQGLNILIGLVRNKFTALLLGPGGMGLASLFNTIISFISQATNLGISFSAVKHLSEIIDSGDDERICHFVKVIRTWTLVTAVLGMLVCIILAPFLGEHLFGWNNHTIHFIILSPVVAMTAVTGGETAILKAARKIKALALVQVCLVFVSLFVSVPVYYFFGITGIIPVIGIMAFAGMAVTVSYSFRIYPFRIDGFRLALNEGSGMVRLGVAFILAGILGSGVELLIRLYLTKYGNLETVGLYNAGYILTCTYAGMVFSAMETDYFPRLSAVNRDVESVNHTVNHQIEASLLILSPMLVILIILLPFLIPLLYSSNFVPVVDMTQIAVLSMYMRVIYLPIAYITLAKGDSWPYLILETVSGGILIVLTVCGYQTLGLTGTGIAIFMANMSDLVIIYIYAHVRYHYAVSSSVIKFAAIQFSLGLMTMYVAMFVKSQCIYMLLGISMTAVSGIVSVFVFRKKTALWDTFKCRILHKD